MFGHEKTAQQAVEVLGEDLVYMVLCESNGRCFCLRKFLQHVEIAYKENADTVFSVEGNSSFTKAFGIGLLHEGAFFKTNSNGTSDMYYKLNEGEYPFTEQGETTLKQHWYLRLQSNILFAIIRDLFAAIGFIAALCAAVDQLFR